MRKLLLLILLAWAGRLAALPAFDFSVTDSDGNQHDLYADYILQGKAVVLELFFTSCPPCNTHAPHFQTLYQNMKTQHAGKVEFFLMTTSSSDTNVKVAQYKTSKSMNMPGVGWDGNSQNVVDDYQGGYFGPYLGTPTFVVIAPYTGEVFFDIRGSSPQNTMTLLTNLVNHLIVPAPLSMTCEMKTPTGASISEVQINVSASVLDTNFTANGTYKLSAIPALQSTLPYDVWARKNTGFLNGVTTFDLVLTSKHILNLEPFNASWKNIAADVNQSGTVTTFDIVESRKLILGIYDTFPASPSWVFLPDTGWDVNGYCVPFQGIKKGDVNGSASFVGSADERGRPRRLEAEDCYLEAGASIALPLNATTSFDLLGFQAALEFDPNDLEIKDIRSGCLPGFDRSAWYDGRLEKEGILPFNWFDAFPQAIGVGNTLLELHLIAKKSGRLSDLLRLSDAGFPAESYDRNGLVHPFELQWITRSGITIMPNPAREYFSIRLKEMKSGEIHITIYDLLGRLAYEQSVEKTGLQIDIYPGSIPAGLYVVCLDGLPAGKLQYTP
jgi:hypothetical protein